MGTTLKVIMKMLSLIHAENVLILRSLCTKEQGDKIAEYCDSEFDKIIKGDEDASI